MIRRYWLYPSLLFILSACNLAMATPVPVVVQPTRAYVNISQPTSALIEPTATRAIQSIPTQTPLIPIATPEAQATVFACGLDESSEHIQHQVVATVDYADKRIQVAQSIRYRNDEQVGLEEIVLAVEPNAYEGAFALTQIMLNSDEPFHTLNRNRLTVRLPSPLNPGCAVTVQLTFELTIPRIGIGASSFKGFFGYSERQINLGHWLPTPATRLNGTWVLHDVQAIGEQNVLEQADWDVMLTVNNANQIRIAAPGSVEVRDENQWHYQMNSARDFPMSLSPSWQLSEATTRDGTRIEIYHFGDTIRSVSGNTVNGANHALTISVQAFEQYESLFGDYPYERFLVVQGDFPDGMEFSGLVFISTNWFYSFEGGIQNYLSLITIHEVSHQWWYARIGNDAAYAPWLDEALATYSEYVYIEEYYPQFRDWWWSFRVAWFNPQGAVDSDVYQFESPRDYINAVYLRGVQMLHNLRENIGTEAFFELLAAYAQAGDGQVATPDLFWSLFTPEQLDVTRGTRDAFLRNPIETLVDPSGVDDE
ncbi:MAG: M1 family metallopeptidase [Anaerolineae bacterium]